LWNPWANPLRAASLLHLPGIGEKLFGGMSVVKRKDAKDAKNAKEERA